MIIKEFVHEILGEKEEFVRIIKEASLHMVKGTDKRCLLITQDESNVIKVIIFKRE